MAPEMQRIGVRFPLLLLCAAFANAQPGCPEVTFSTSSSAALNTSFSTSRILRQQQDGSYTAYELLNSPPFSLVRTIPHFEKQLSPCVAETTGLNSSSVGAAAQLATGGLLLATGGYFVEYDAGMNFVAAAKTNVPVGLFADVNGDGIPDAIGETTLNHNPAISVSLGSGGVVFQPPVLIPIIPTPGIGSFAVADINGDHKPDILLFSYEQILVLYGNGDGTFRAPAVLYSALGSSLAIGDLNGDGKPDLVFGDVDATLYTPVVRVALGVGDGTFQTPVEYAVGSTGSISIGDANGDGIPDIIVSGATILLGDGTGKFPARKDVLTTVYSPVFATDINGDGIPDLVAAQGSAAVLYGDSVSVVYGLGKMAFTGPKISPVPHDPSTDQVWVALASADINGDGIADLLTADNLGHIAALKGAGDGTFQSPWQFTLAQSQVPSGIITADFNHDGNLDFAVVASGYTSTATGEVDVFPGNGDGTFQSPVHIVMPLGAFALAAGDFNGDGKLDLAVLISQEGSGVSNSVLILNGAGDGTFSSGATYPMGPYAFSIAAADLNGDGKLDLVVTNPGTYANNYLDGSISLLMGKGDGTFRASTLSYVAGPNHAPLNVAIADFNGDGKPDMAVTLSNANYGTGGLAIFLGRGDGTFLTPVIYGADVFAVQAVDINGDGILDLVVSQSNESAGPGIRYMLGNGDGTFQPPIGFNSSVSSQYTPFPLAIADFNGDGRPDIAAFATGGIAAFVNMTNAAPAVRLVSAASLEPGPLAPDSIATAFGKNLNGTVEIEDSTGTSFPGAMFYSSPTQVNFAIPAGVAVGPVTVSIGSQTAETVLAPAAPSLFTFNEQGLAAAYVERVSGSAVTYEPVYQAQNGVLTALPIDVTTGQAYLVLFGTGLRNGGGTRAFGNGELIGVEYSGPQSQTPGLDQVNLVLPSSLAGSGILVLTLAVGGLAANSVYVAIQ